MLIPHDRGSKAVRIKFQRRLDLPKRDLPRVAKFPLGYLDIEVKDSAASPEGGSEMAQAAADGSKTDKPMGGAA